MKRSDGTSYRQFANLLVVWIVAQLELATVLEPKRLVQNDRILFSIVEYALIDLIVVGH